MDHQMQQYLIRYIPKTHVFFTRELNQKDENDLHASTMLTQQKADRFRNKSAKLHLLRFAAGFATCNAFSM